MPLSTMTPHVSLKPIPYFDYEVFLGPIGLYDWRGDSLFDIKFALSLLPPCDSHMLPYGAVSGSTVTPFHTLGASELVHRTNTRYTPSL